MFTRLLSHLQMRRSTAFLLARADERLLDDIGLSRALKRRSRPAALRLRVTTAGRRWDAHGPLRTILFMWWLRLRFYLGASPAHLAARYAAVR